MENKIAELKKIKEALEVLINESEKPKFEVGWLKLTGYNVFCYTTDFKSGYGISHKDIWTNKMFIDNLDYWEQATHSEVQEALTKEAVKRGFKEGVIFIAPTSKNRFTAKGEIEIWKSGDTFGLSFSNSQGLILDNGKWAEIIKTKTIDELASELYELNHYEIKPYLAENKQTIIETLNNL